MRAAALAGIGLLLLASMGAGVLSKLRTARNDAALSVPGAGRGVFASVDVSVCDTYLARPLSAQTEMPAGAAVPSTGSPSPFSANGLQDALWQANLPADGPTNATSWAQLINANMVGGLEGTEELLYWERAGELGLAVYDLATGRVVQQGAYAGQLLGQYQASAWVGVSRDKTTVLGAVDVHQPGFSACYAASGEDGEDPPLSTRDGGVLKVDALGRAAVGGAGMYTMYDSAGDGLLQLLTVTGQGEPARNSEAVAELGLAFLEEAGAELLVASSSSELVGIGPDLTVRWRQPLSQFGPGFTMNGMVVHSGAGAAVLGGSGVRMFNPDNGELGWSNPDLFVVSKHESHLGSTVAYLGGSNTTDGRRVVVVLGVSGEIGRVEGTLVAAEGDLAVVAGTDRTVILRAGKEIGSLVGARAIGVGPKHLLIAHDTVAGTTLYAFELPEDQRQDNEGGQGQEEEATPSSPSDPEQSGPPTTVPSGAGEGEGEGEPPAV